MTAVPRTTAARRGTTRRRKSFDRPGGLWVVFGVVVVFLFAPIAAVVVYSFNAVRSLAVLDGFSLQWYHQAFTDPSLRASFLLSLLVAVISAAVATVLGTGMAIGVARSVPWLRWVSNGAVAIRLISPETATAVALFLLFQLVGIPLSFTSLLIAHVALSIAFVMVVVRSRVTAIGPEIEDAAMDLGATPTKAVILVILPLLVPAIVVAGILSFVLSFDNFVTSFFTTGIGTQPLPVLIYSMLRFGVTPVVNAMGVIMLVVSVLGVLIAAFAYKRMTR